MYVSRIGICRVLNNVLDSVLSVIYNSVDIDNIDIYKCIEIFLGLKFEYVIFIGYLDFWLYDVFGVVVSWKYYGVLYIYNDGDNK